LSVVVHARQHDGRIWMRRSHLPTSRYEFPDAIFFT
jgi:hypothetical protein